MPSFEDIGLRAELLHLLEDDEFAAPTALQQAVIPTLRRGGNLVARTSSGSGKTLAYTLGILDRLGPSNGGEDEAGEEDAGALRVLILTATPAEAERAATTVTRYAESLALRVAVLGGGWGTRPSEAAIIISAAGDVMDAVRSSVVKLETLEAIVIDGASTILELGHWKEVDDLVDLLPRDAQRVLISAALRNEVEDLAGRQVKKALRYPSEAAIPEGTPAVAERAIGYVLATESEKLDLLAAQLQGRDAGTSPPLIFCRSDEQAADLAEQLTVRGFLVGEPGEVEADVAIAAGGATLQELADEVEGDVGQTISYDVPPDPATLRARHEGDDDGVVLTLPRELAHLREIALPAGFRLRAAPVGGIESQTMRALSGFRDSVRQVIRKEDLTPQMLLLEPLFSEFSAVEIAAALTLITRRRPVATGTDSKGEASSDERSTAAPRAERVARDRGASSAGREGAGRVSPRAGDSGPAPVTWARLYVGIGSRDDVKPGDLVGGLAGEANIPGSRIGKIEIRDSFSIVEVQADVADQVIRAVNGTTLKGRSVRVDYDRGGPARRPDNRSGPPPRRTTRRPPS